MCTMDGCCTKESGYFAEQYTFIGREKELQNLQEKFLNTMLSDRPITRVILITGEPMVGKTRLSKEIGDQLVRDVHQSYQHLDVHFIDLRRVTDFRTIIITLSAAVGIPPCWEYDIIKHFRRCKHHCLVIFDSADHLSVDISAELQTRFLDFCTSLVNNTKVLLLITSRFQYKLLSIIPKVYHHRLQPLSVGESVELLKSIAFNVDFTGNIDEKIAKFCAGIPLALSIAATELQENTYSPHELYELLENNRLDALSPENYSQGDQVRHVIKSSVDRLRRIRLDYIKLSFIPSSFNAEAVAYILKFPKKSAFAKQKVLIPLTTRSLLARDTLNDRFDIHDFLREYLSDELSLLPMRQLLSLRNRYCLFYGKLLQALAPVVEEDSCKKLPLFTVEIVNIQKLLHEAALCPTEDYDLFLDIACKAEYLIINFLPRKEAVEFYAACVRAAESRNKKKHLGLMLSSYGQALNFTASDWKFAQEMYERALECLVPFGDTVDMAWLLNHIGWNFHMQGFWRDSLRYFVDAESTLMRMSQIDRNKDGRWERILASVWSCLGISYVCIDEPDRGIQYHEKALCMRRKLWGDHPSIGGTYNNMSLAYIRIGDKDKALLYSQKGLDTKMRFNKQPANDIIVSLNNVAINTCFYKGDPEKAHILLDKSLEMRKSLGLQHVDTALIASNRGKVYEYQKEYSQAIKYYEQAVKIRENLQGQHSSTARALYNLACLKMKLDKLDDALQLFNKCYKIRKLTANKRSQDLAEIMEGLGILHEKLSEIHTAEKYFCEALEEFHRLRTLFEEEGTVNQVNKMITCVSRIQTNLHSIRSRPKLSVVVDYGVQNIRNDNDDDESDDNDGKRSVWLCATSVNKYHDGDQAKEFKSEGSNVRSEQAQGNGEMITEELKYNDHFKLGCMTKIEQVPSECIPRSPESAYSSSGSSLANLFQLSIRNEETDNKDVDEQSKSGYIERKGDIKLIVGSNAVHNKIVIASENETETLIRSCASLGKFEQDSEENLHKKPNKHGPRIPRGRIMYREEFERMKYKSNSVPNGHDILHKLELTDIKFKKWTSMANKENNWNNTENQNQDLNEIVNKNIAYYNLKKESVLQSFDTDIKEMIKCNYLFYQNPFFSFDEFKEFPRNRPVYFHDEFLLTDHQLNNNLLLTNKQQRGSQIVVDMILDHDLPNEAHESFKLQGKP